MAEIPPGPSSLLPPPPAAAEPCCPCPAGAAPVCCSEDEEDDEEHRGGGGGGREGGGRGRGPGPAGEAAASKGHQRLRCPQPPPPPAPLAQQQQLNGLISPELRHLRAAASLKSKIVGAADAASGPAADGSARATAAKRAGQPPSERPPHPLPTNARTAPPNPAAPAAAASGLASARNGLAGGTEQEEEEEEEEDESLLLLSSSLTAVCGLTTSCDREAEPEEDRTIRYVRYESELQMPDIMRLITKDLSEPYSIYTYRYFIHNWPQLCFLAVVGEECVGAIVCKLDMHKKMFRRGYIAMLAVDSKYRRNGIGTNLVKKAIYAMVEGDCDEVVLETEITNKSALKLYENLGFVRDKRLFRYYLNGVDALRLKLWLR
ncbi:N-alpha-acetyltransferase 30 [Phascolarctos cinereus]|uniref:N-alpha-acetyltransferase 30 n=1 Tax=Phascolarctos cinereus TaxID=38626 RepID=A0A6P5K9M7_PHACI|nr:N-alpha-acetyltransferase 30 [Phascolarctos cinereus]XP_020842116.1 N-alpha-acetyltransferase 30 [Phascolarctos cinereus]